MELMFKSKDMFLSNYNRICRTCIKAMTEPLHNIFDSEVLVLNESIRTCELLVAVSTLKMHPNDDLPKGICIQCLDSVMKAYNFQKMCILSDLCMRSLILPTTLKEYNQKSQPVNQENINKYLSSPNIIGPCVRNVLSYKNEDVKVPYTESLHTVPENIVQPKELEPSNAAVLYEEINNVKFLLLPSNTELNKDTEVQALVIPNQINHDITPLTADSGLLQTKHVVPLSTKTSTSVELSTNVNGFNFESVTRLSSDEINDSLTNKTELKFDVPLKEIPPWKRGRRLFSIDSGVHDLCVQNVMLPCIENQKHAEKSTITEISLLISPDNSSEKEDFEDVETRVYAKENHTDNSNESNSETTYGIKDAEPNDFADVKKEIKTNKVSNQDLKKIQFSENSICEVTAIGLGGDSDDTEGMLHPEANIIEESNSRSKHLNYTCEFCGKSFVRRSRLDVHLRRHRKNGHRRRFECEICCKRFILEFDLHRHSNVHEDIYRIQNNKKSTNENQCPECLKFFLNKEYLNAHMESHRNQLDISKRFECEVCSKLFESVNNFISHKKEHKETRQYNCEICGKTFSLKHKLTAHLKTHIVMKCHVCEICQKSFRHASLLRDHRRTHTGEQPFLCSECGKSFQNASNLRQHQL